MHCFVSDWATFVCSSRVAQDRHFVDRYIVKQEEKCFKMSKSCANLVLGLRGQSLLHILSYLSATLVCSPRYKILVCNRLTLGYWYLLHSFVLHWATVGLYLCVAQG